MSEDGEQEAPKPVDPKQLRCLIDVERAQADGEHVETHVRRRFEVQHAIVVAALKHPHALLSTGLSASDFTGSDYAVIWSSIEGAIAQNKALETLGYGDIYDYAKKTSPRFRTPDGNNALHRICREHAVGIEYALKVLVRELRAVDDLAVWANTARSFSERAEKSVDPLALREEWITEAQGISRHYDFGPSSVSIDEAAAKWRQKASSGGIVPTGFQEIDGPTGGGLGRGDMMTVGGGTNHGKCLRFGTLTLLANGETKRVEELLPGDRLMGPDGSPRTVLMASRGEGEMFEIRPNRGQSFFCNEDHILTLVGTGRPSKNRKEKHEEINTCRYGGKIVDVSVREWMTWSKKRKHHFKLFRASAVEFEGGQRPLPIDPYFFGLLLGDGATQGTPNVTTQDGVIVREVYAQASALGLTISVMAKPNNKASTYALVRQKGSTDENALTRKLRDLGVHGCKSGDKFIPSIYKTASVAERLQLLAGLMDTDGATNDGSYDYISKSERLASDVVFVARSVGLSAHMSQCKKKCQTGAEGTYWRVGIGGIGVNGIPCRIEHKRLPPRGAKQRDSRKTGFEVIPTGTVEPYYGFTIDGDGRFLLGDFTVTHNSYVGAKMLRNQADLGRNVLLISVEDSEELLMCRMLADYSDPPLSPKDIRMAMHGLPSPADPKMIDAAAVKMRAHQQGRVRTIHLPKAKVSQVCNAIRQHRYLYGVDMVIVDYLQAVQPDETSNNKTQDVAFITSELKKTAGEVGVALVVLSQYARDEYRNGAEPTVNSCKYAGDIENESEVMLLLWRDEDQVLRGKLAKLKWASAVGHRYIIATHQTTGAILDWVRDTEEPADRDEQPRRPSGNRGGGGSRMSGGR